MKKEGQKLTPGQDITLSFDEERNFTEEICEMVKDVVNSRNKSFKDNLITWRKNYEMMAESKSFPWTGSSNLKEPVTEITTDAVWSRLDRSLLAYDPLYLVSHFNKETPEAKLSAQKYENFIDFDLRNNIRPMKVLSDYLFNCVLDGIGILKVNWLSKMYRLVARGGGKTILYNSPQISLIDILDFFFPPFAKTIDDSWTAQRIWLSEYDVMMRKEKFGYKIPANLGSATTKDDKEEYEKEVLDIEGISTTQKENPYNLNFSIVEWWGMRKIGTKMIPVVATVFLKERFMARIVVNPFVNLMKPFVAGSAWPRANRIIGRGMGQKMMHMQSETDTIHNQRLDRITLKLAPIFKVRKGSLSPDEQEFYPLKFFEVDDMNDVQEWQLSDVPSSAFQEETILHSLIEKSSGVSDYALGRESSVLQTRATARGTLAVIQEGDKKFDKMVQNLTQSFLELIKKLDILYKENIVSDVFVPQLKDILIPEEIAEQYNFEFKPSKITINKEVRQQKALQVFDLLSQNPLFQGNIELIQQITKDFLYTFEKQDIAKLLDDNVYVKNLVQISQLSQQAQALTVMGQVMEMKMKMQQMMQPPPPPGAPPPPGGEGGAPPPPGGMM